jgi:hypothetical protein
MGCASPAEDIMLCAGVLNVVVHVGARDDIEFGRKINADAVSPPACR